MTVPKMTIAIDTVDRNEFHVAVTHGPAQSYSRAVDPRAMRAGHEHMKATGLTGNWALVDSTYGDWDGDINSRVTSTFIFRRQEAA